jgi:hypothetical protein
MIPRSAGAGCGGTVHLARWRLPWAVRHKVMEFMGGPTGVLRPHCRLPISAALPPSDLCRRTSGGARSGPSRASTRASRCSSAATTSPASSTATRHGRGTGDSGGRRQCRSADRSRSSPSRGRWAHSTTPTTTCSPVRVRARVLVLEDGHMYVLRGRRSDNQKSQMRPTAPLI